jgi:acyl homoserine lactone synthase
MQVVAINDARSPLHAEWLKQSFQLRARIFYERLGWSVKLSGSEEFDIFDELHPTYLMAVDSKNQVVGTVRFLPADGPIMLTTVFSSFLAGIGIEGLPRDLVEASRFCVDTATCRDRQFLNNVTRTLFTAMLDWTMRRGHPLIAVVVDLRMERILRRAGWPLCRICDPRQIGQVASVAGYLSVNPEAFAALRPPTYLFIDAAAEGPPLCRAC